MSMSGEHGLLLCIILYAKEREGLTAWYKSGHMMHVNTYSDRGYEACLQFIQQLDNIIQ